MKPFSTPQASSLSLIENPTSFSAQSYMEHPPKELNHITTSKYTGHKSFQQFCLTVLMILFTVGISFGQTSFSGSIVNTAGNSLIPSSGPGGCNIAPQNSTPPGTRFNTTVSGITALQLKSVSINLTHTWVADLGIFLQGPNNEIIELTTGNGSFGYNYTNTVFRDDASTPITAGSAPFTGTFLPEGTTAVFCSTSGTVSTLAGMASGTNANGLWTLIIEDDFEADGGNMLGWSLEFDQQAITCSSPTSLTASNVSHNAATLSWTNPTTGSPPMNYQWVLMPDDVVPSVVAALATGSVVHPTATATATGLTALTSYDAYVRTDCGNGDYSDWSNKVDINTLATPPFNDHCSGALNFNGSGVSGNFIGVLIYGSTVGATQSQAGCVGNADDDVWFSFTTTATGGDFTISSLGINGFDVVLEMFTGTCGSLTSIGCQNATGASSSESFQVTSALANTTYYVRVYDFGTSLVGGLNDRAAGSFNITASGSALPVELLSFRGEALEKTNKLTWKTATEENTSKFIVERSANGRTDFEPIGQIKAAGNSIDALSYTMEDEQPIGMGYYRLKMEDLDGTFEYSAMVTIERKDKGVHFVNVYPVPTSAEVTVVYTTPEIKDVTVVVTDLMGRNMQTLQLVSNKGVNNQTVDMTAMPAGTYFISITDGVSQQVRRITKQ